MAGKGSTAGSPRQPGVGGLAGKGRTVADSARRAAGEGASARSTRLIDVIGRATIEAVLQVSAEQVAGPRAHGRRGPNRGVYCHGVHGGRIALRERHLRVTKPRLPKKRSRADQSGRGPW